jgi:uncharacterized membrane-anchored protein YhcB (DUF1043 family)
MDDPNQSQNNSAEIQSEVDSVYAFRDGRQEGPFPLASIRMQCDAGLLSIHDLCWRPGWEEWKPIRTLAWASPYTSIKIGLIISLAWRKTVFFLHKILTPLYWATPEYWFLRSHKAECLALASKKLPATYDPVGEELLLRSRVIEDSTANHPEPLPSTDAISGIIDRLDEAVDERRKLIIGAAEIGAYATFDVVSGFAAIDKNVFEGMSHLRSEQISTLSDLSKVLKEYDHSTWSGLSSGALVKVQGHIGESVVAQHLQSAGLKVDWPETSNNQGWDLAINGQHLDVKAAAKDAWSSSISNHFAEHPNIPVVVAGDALHIPHDALHFNSELGTGFDVLAKAMEHGGGHQIFVDDALSNIDLHDHVQHATSTALGSPDVAHHHFPFVTLALSGYKEVSLLFNDKTDPLTALKHVFLDTAGTGIGGLAGAKAGALIGCFFGPIGAGLGVFVGGIAGAIAARTVTNDIKHQDFEDAKGSYEAATQRLRTQLSTEEASAKTQLSALRKSGQDCLLVESREIKETIEVRTTELQQWSDSSQVVYRCEGLPLTEDASNQIKALIDVLKEHARGHGIWRRWIWPHLPSMADEMALRFLRRVAMKLDEFSRRLAIGESVSRNELFSLLGVAGVVRPEVMSYLDAIYAVQSARQRQLQADVQSQMAKLMEKRAQVVRGINETAEALAASIRTKLAPLIAERERRENRLKIEARKLGMSY